MTKVRLLRERPIILLFIGFYGCFLIGMLYTEHLDVGRFNLEKKMSLLALPLIIGTSQSYNGDIKSNALKVFAFSLILASAACLMGALYQYFLLNDTTVFFHDKLTSTLELQAPYFGMFLVMTIIILVNHWIDARNQISSSKSVMLGIALLFLVGFVVLLSARTATAFLLLYGATSVFMLGTKRQRWFATGLGVIGIALMLTMIANSGYLQDRFIKPLMADISVTSGGQETGLSIRLVKWACSFEGVVEAPLLGVGTGDAEAFLVQCYEKENFWGKYPQYRFNSHNQYLETALTLGMVGLLVFLGTIVIPAIGALKRRDKLFLSFLALFAFCCLTESVLERQWGVIFFSLFVSLFSFSSDQAEERKRS